MSFMDILGGVGGVLELYLRLTTRISRRSNMSRNRLIRSKRGNERTTLCNVALRTLRQRASTLFWQLVVLQRQALPSLCMRLRWMRLKSARMPQR